jgi:hypothetical protein
MNETVGFKKKKKTNLYNNVSKKRYLIDSSVLCIFVESFGSYAFELLMLMERQCVLLLIVHGRTTH